MKLRVIAVFCILFLANCSRKETKNLQDSAPPAASAELSAPDAAASATVSAWTDGPIVEKLRADCAFDPRKLSDADKTELFGNPFGVSELTCGGDGFDQACAYDPCFEGDLHDCRGGCLAKCSTCDDDCTSTCFACKANCEDDTCRNACAPMCAQCKQSCLATQDQCRSGTCGAVYGECRKRLDASWKSQNCAAICTQYEPCRTRCYEKMGADHGGNFDHVACLAQCKSGLKTSCDLGLCGGKYSMAIEMK